MNPALDIINFARRSGRRSTLWLSGLFLLLYLPACDRPFVDPRLPVIEIQEPNPDRLFFDSTIVLKARASSFRAIDRLERDGRPMRFDEETGLWIDSLRLTPGINSVEVKAFDIEDFSGSETLSLAHIRPRFLNDAPGLPAPWRLGGHTATLLPNGDLLVCGGAIATNQPSTQAAFLLPRNAAAFEQLNRQLVYARQGHTASLLPDGRVLIMGGSTSPTLVNASQLVTTAEIYDPDTGRFSVVPIQGTALQRAHHVSFVSPGSGEPIIDVFGGLGPDPGSGSQRLVTRRDFRTFILVGDTLRSLGAVGETIEDVGPAFGLASVEILAPTSAEPGMYLITGTEFLDSQQNSVNFTIDFSTVPIRIDLLPSLQIPRTFHTAVSIDQGLYLFTGGYQGTLGTALNSSEIYLESANRFFVIDDRVPTRSRFLHTATKLPSQRILVLGGFFSSGEAIEGAQYFTWGLDP